MGALLLLQEMTGRESDAATIVSSLQSARKWIVLLVLVVTAVVIFSLLGVGGPDVGDVETVQIVSNGEVVTTVSAETAVTSDERETGLSDHESLESGSGMLFYHSGGGEQTYVMPDMDFGIDIIFIGSDCLVNSIHSADRPGPGEDGYEPKHRYTGEGQYVLEVSMGYAGEYVSEGDRVVFAGGCERKA